MLVSVFPPPGPRPESLPPYACYYVEGTRWYNGVEENMTVLLCVKSQVVFASRHWPHAALAVIEDDQWHSMIARLAGNFCGAVADGVGVLHEWPKSFPTHRLIDEEWL